MHVFHREKQIVALDVDLEHLDDVRVMDARDDTRFLEERAPERRVGRVVSVELLDGHDLRHAIRRHVPREVDRGDPSRRETVVNLVTAAGVRHVVSCTSG